MKIIFFNIWHGKVWNELREFLLDQAATTDIFCFTEVDPALQIKLVETLTGFQPFYDEIIRTDYLDGGIDGQSFFVKSGIEVENYWKQQIYEVTKKDAGILQAAQIIVNGKNIFFGSVHGMAQPGHKLDTPERIKQSEKILNFFKDKKGTKIIGGDFNLLPVTESVKMFEKAGYKNLIHDFDIKTTRNRLSWEQFENDPNYTGKQFFADYVFVSPEVKVKTFEVPNIEISDHLPLILDFEI